ncbi:enoyl-CoA hydratase-related protein [Halorussus gelatinilyticus]|uniref:Enoyl-CoA hydratase-related protein n=1 Tax=Halorussus gelatinilyticus TaxID=2937524 RepID=A0A8U0IFC7_9EURY|nr:enoyl-CoA hydratase-related protein [Halorussus gelatinilyticus]UPV98911.1 enoyl-CoA hydratase-related protein [Halorussus gelatinilyticus]
MTGESVALDIADGVATVTLSEPDRRNALSTEMSAEVRDALADIAESDARCVAVEGAGEAFSAGGDIAAMRERFESDESLDEQVRRLERTTSETVARLATFPLPTVAKIDGAAFGAGANLAIACDVQLASDDASVGFGFRQVGLSIDAGTSYLLPRIVGENVAKELVFTGELVGAERALDLGLVNRVYPAEEFDERADQFVDRVATGPTVALRHAKRLLGEGLDKSVQRAMTDEATAQGIVFETDDHEEGVRAFLEDREPKFEGR